MVEWWLPGIVFAGSCILFTGLYLWQLRSGDAGIVDVGWSGGIGLAALFYLFASEAPLSVRAAGAVVAIPWSARLAWYLLSDRVMRGEEDGRYATLRESWGKNAPARFRIVFGMNAVLVLLFSLPYFAVLVVGASQPGWLLLAGVGIGWLAMAGESLSDWQLQQWRSNPDNKGKTCRQGLWRYSRHPNYFFEWLHWWAYVVMTAGTWWMLVAIGGPALMFFFLYRFTGIPYTERQAVKSRGEDYRRYQETTSAFFPWFPKEDAR